MISTRPIKVLHVCTVDGTAHILLSAQLKALEEAGYEVHLACSPGVFSPALRDAGFRVHGIRFVKRVASFGHVLALVELYRLMRRERYAIVHVHNVITAVLGRIAARLARVPIVIYTLHGFYFHEHMSPPVRWVHVWLERLCGRLTDLMLSQADEDRRTAIAEQIIAADNILTIGNGVDIARFSHPALALPAVCAQLKRELGIPPEAPVVGTVGRIVREKGFREFFEAAVQIVRSCPEAVFLIVGDTLDSDRGKFSTKLRALIRANRFESHFFFTGFRLDPEHFYPIMDVVVLPSYREGMPRTVIEAMAAARPVVATNIRGCREEVVEGETGLLVPVRDARALAKAIVPLLQNPKVARRMGQAGQQRAKELFDEQSMCTKIVAAYQTIVAQKVERSSSKQRVVSSAGA